MNLNFEVVGVVGKGKYPDFIQFEKTEGELFYLDSGLFKGKPTLPLKGEFDDPTFLDVHDITPQDDTNLTHLELNSLQGFGVIGSYTTNTKQRLIIYEFQNDISRYLSNGSIKHSAESPIPDFSLVLENPIDKETEIEDQVILSESEGLIKPGAKVIFQFTLGDEEPMEMGVFYVDNTDFRTGADTAAVNGRNLIGKALKDQSVNEEGTTDLETISNIIERYMYHANLSNDQYIIQDTATRRRYEFEPSKSVLDCMTEIFKTMVTWKIEELPDGTIVVGNELFPNFPIRSTYTFQRGSEVFSRQIKMNDVESFRKVCVHDREWNIKVYRDVEAYTGWNLQSNKTLFVSVPEGTSIGNATNIAEDLASRLENVGKIETFEGPFRPQLLIGDSAKIVDKNGQHTLGLITEIEHRFGKQGFSTVFTVDSGGRLGRGRLKDLIAKIDRAGSSGSIEYEDLGP